MKKEYIKPNVVLLEVNSFIIISNEEHKADDSWAKSTSIFEVFNSDYFEEETKLKVQFHDIWDNDD